MINNFIKRAITGVLFVAILVGGILYDAFSFGILFTAISALTIYEFGQLVNMRAEGVKINKTINMLGGAYLFLAIMGFCIDAADSKIFRAMMSCRMQVVPKPRNCQALPWSTTLR